MADEWRIRRCRETRRSASRESTRQMWERSHVVADSRWLRRHPGGTGEAVVMSAELATVSFRTESDVAEDES
jgi:hypothetical protein